MKYRELKQAQTRQETQSAARDKASEEVTHAAPFIETPRKRHLISERWGAATKAQIFADAVLLNSVSSTDWNISSLEPVPVSQKAQGDQSLPLPSSKHMAPTRNFTPTPALHSPVGKTTQPKPPKPSAQGRAPELKQMDVGHVLIFLALQQTLHRPTNKA